MMAHQRKLMGKHSLAPPIDDNHRKLDLQEFDSCAEAFGTKLSTGIWTSRGYGFAVEVQADQNCTIYQETTTSCVEDSYFFDWYLFGAFTEIDENAVSIDMDQQVDIFWDRTGTFQSGCADGVTPSLGQSDDYEPDALRTFDFFYQTHVELYAFFEVRGVDWDAVTSEVRATLSSNSTDEELLDAMSSCILPLKDYHSLIRAGDETVSSQGLPIFEQLFLEWADQDEILLPEVYLFTQVVAWGNILAGYMDEGSVGGEIFDPAVFWGTIDDGAIAYLQLNSMGWGDDQEAVFAMLDNLMTNDFADSHTLILDLRVNEGGNDRSALRVASYFVDEPTVAFQKRTMIYPDAWTPTTEIYIEPNPDVQFQGQNIILIMSSSCGSACETGSMAFLQTPQFLTSLGRNTLLELPATTPNAVWTMIGSSTQATKSIRPPMELSMKELGCRLIS